MKQDTLGSGNLVQGKKARVYELFAHIFAKEPTSESLHLFQREEIQDLFSSYGVDCLADIRHLRPEEQVETLAVEYADLFLAPSSLAPAYESLQLGEGKLWGTSTVEVHNLYKKFGFDLCEEFRDAPDHLSAELYFLANLCQLQEEYEKKGLLEAKKGVLEVKKYFLDNHLLKWFGSFKNQVERGAKFSYYKELVRLLDMILDEEWIDLREVKDISPEGCSAK